MEKRHKIRSDKWVSAVRYANIHYHIQMPNEYTAKKIECVRLIQYVENINTAINGRRIYCRNRK